MASFIFKVGDVFAIKGRGIILCPPDRAEPYAGPTIRRGSRIELRSPGRPPLQTEITGLDFVGKTVSIPIRTPEGFSKEDVPSETELWLTDEEQER